MSATGSPSGLEVSPSAASSPSGARFGVGLGLSALVGLALLAWFGVRVQAKLQANALQASARQEIARKAASESQQPAAIATVEGSAETWHPSVSIDGTLMPKREADLGFRVPGRLASIRVHTADWVQQGAVLGTLDTTEAQGQLAVAQAQLRAAKAQLDLTEDASQRMNALATAGAATAAAGVQTQQQRALATAQRDVAGAQVDLMRSNLANHTLTAPFSGYISRTPSGPGAIVNPGVPLFHVQDTRVLRFVGTVGERDVALIHVGDTVELALPGKKVTGRVVSTLASVDNGTRRAPVEAEIENHGPQPLLAGIFVRGAVRSQLSVPVLRLPASALRPGSQDEIVVVVDGRARLRQIEFVSADDGSILVRAGLAAGERVMRTPTAQTRDGAPVASAAPRSTP